MNRGTFGQPLPARAMLDALTGTTHKDQCPDCDADAEMVRHETGVYVLQIRHDPTCPALAARRGRR